MKTHLSKLYSSIAYAVVLTTIVAVPHVASAAPGNLRDIIKIVIGYLNDAIYLIIGLATISFVWNVYKLYFVPDADRTEAGEYVLYSVIGFFVMLSMWGLVNLVSGTFKLDNNRPALPFAGSADSGTSAASRSGASGQNVFGGPGYTPAGYTNNSNGYTPAGYTNNSNGTTPAGYTNTAGGTTQAGSSNPNGEDDPQEQDVPAPRLPTAGGTGPRGTSQP